MIKVEQTAKTVDEAIEIVLSQYNVTRDDIKVTVVDEGKKGFWESERRKPRSLWRSKRSPKRSKKEPWSL